MTYVFYTRSDRGLKEIKHSLISQKLFLEVDLVIEIRSPIHISANLIYHTNRMWFHMRTLMFVFINKVVHKMNY